MSHNEPVRIRIGRRIWQVVRNDETTSGVVYKASDVYASGGEIPDFATSD